MNQRHKFARVFGTHVKMHLQFGLFADGLHRHLLQRCLGVGPPLRNGTCVPDLGCADNFALLATTPADLQRLIDAAAEFCDQTGMVISVDKTKVLDC